MALGKGTVGTITRDADGNWLIFVLGSLGAEQKIRVFSHEVGHLIDELSGQIDTSGITKELRQVYDDLYAGPSFQGATKHMTRPEHLGYSVKEAPRELVAEAFRACMVDPSYIETVAPKTAARPGAVVSTSPRVARILQHDAVVPLALPGLRSGQPAGEAEKKWNRAPDRRRWRDALLARCDVLP